MPGLARAAGFPRVDRARGRFFECRCNRYDRIKDAKPAVATFKVPGRCACIANGASIAARLAAGWDDDVFRIEAPWHPW